MKRAAKIASFPKTVARNLRLFLIVCALLSGAVLPHGTIGAPSEAQAASPVPMLYSSAPNAPDSQLQSIIEDTVGNLGGNWGVAVKKLDTGQFAAFNGDTQQVSASLYKLWVLDELFRQAQAGDLDLDGYNTVTADDAYYDEVNGDVHLNAGDSVTLRRAAYLMVTVSDNTSAHMLVRILGPDNINSFMQRNGLQSSLLDWSGVGDNLTTPLDMLRELELIATSRMVDAGASKQMVDLMLDQQINDLLPPGLPDGARIAHKTGALDGLLHDAAIVYGPHGPFIIVVMASNLTSYQTAWDNMPLLVGRVYNYFNSQSASPTLYFPETRQTVGHDFLKFWQVYGGLQAFGYPIGPEQTVGGLRVQQFERARFEWHPELGGEGGEVPDVVPSLLGQERAAQLGLSWPPAPDPGTGKFYKETGQAITGKFYDYWLNNGGERIFGLPISPAAPMLNPDGKTYLTQWFQRARMELHPELPAGPELGKAQELVALGALGTELNAPH